MNHIETLENIENLISNKIQESLTLEYKSELGKNIEVAKDVSAFANTLSGIIIYGVKEENGLPTTINWIESKGIKERIENITLLSIQPKIEDIKINSISNPNDSTKAIFIVHIPESLEAPHMVNYRYYKRHNFQSMPMEDQEVKNAIFNKGLRKALDFEISENKELADKIYKGINEVYNYPPEKRKPILLIPLHTDAWKMIISSGLFSTFKEKAIELNKFYSLVHEINSLIDYQKSGVETAYIPTYNGSSPDKGKWIPSVIKDKIGDLLSIHHELKVKLFDYDDK